jgi:cold shock CspA family protein
MTAPALFAQNTKSAPITLPADAKKTGDGTWTHTDAQGKEWVYRQMPFGLTRAEKGQVEEFANKAVMLPPGMTALEQGDKVRFSRQTPFGPVTWVKKIDELSDTERAALSLARKKSEAPAEAPKSATPAKNATAKPATK